MARFRARVNGAKGSTWMTTESFLSLRRQVPTIRPSTTTMYVSAFPLPDSRAAGDPGARDRPEGPRQ